MHDVLVVGSGFSGSIIARDLAENRNLKVLLIEKRPHIGGNMYDEKDDNGILVQRYGPHFINTDNYWIIEYLQKYGELVPHYTKLLSYIDNYYVRLPFNFLTVQQLLTPSKAEGLLARLRSEFRGRDRVPIFDLLESPDNDIKQYGELLFEKAYKTYTAKQWGITTDQIDRSVLNRVQMCMGYDERYLNKDFQYLPKLGFKALFDNILNHPNITISLNCDALKNITLCETDNCILYQNHKYPLIVYTGAIDELFGERFGSLPYRSLRFEYRTEKKVKALPSEIISYPQSEGYTRDTEYRQFNYIPVNSNRTTIVREFPVSYDRHGTVGNEAFYPIINEENVALYKRYVAEAEKYNNLFLCGRLAEYKYYNMDLVIESTFSKLQKIHDIYNSSLHRESDD